MISLNLISMQFGALLLGILLLYYLIPLKLRWAVLLLGSIVFYLLAATPYTALYLIVSILSVYLCARYIQVEFAKRKKVAYALVVCLNVGLLVFLKYINGFWAVGTRLFSIFDVSLSPLTFSWLAPLGMSFYTLQLIGYLTDVYWGISAAEKNPAKLALFGCYFPALSSGPILRYNQVKGDLFEGHRIGYQNITFGLKRMLWGLFKKLVIAERMALIVRPIFADVDTYDGAYLWVGLIAAVIQIYADFSGNMDFILGASESFGVRLPENFRQPFFSLTIQEFWQRWHITLGGWLKDYIMYPILRSRLWGKLGVVTKKHLGKKSAKLIPTILAMLLLWVANGIWHGAYLKYMAVVGWFWFAVTAGQLLTPAGIQIAAVLHIKMDCFSFRLFQRLRTMALYAIGALFFVTADTSEAFQIAKRAFLNFNLFDLLSSATFVSDKFLQLTGGKTGLVVAIISLLILIRVEVYQKRGGSVRQWLAQQNMLFRWTILFGLIFSVLIFGVYGPGYDAAEFIYAGF